MLKLLHGEVYRLARKRSMYIYFAALLVGYCLLIFVRSGGFDAESVVSDASYFNFFPALAGGFLFSAIYTDDLNSKNLITLVGYGLSKWKIIVAKFILAVFSSVIFFALLSAIHCGMYAVLGFPPTTRDVGWVCVFALKYLLMTVAFMALSSIVVYGFQRTTFALVAYILLGFSIVYTLVTAIGNVLKLHLGDYLVSGLTDKITLGLISGDFTIAPVLGYAAYLIIAVVLATVALNKKEMEF